MARVLLIEDDGAIIATLHDALADDGHEVRTSYDLEALLWARDGWPDVILLDLWLPYLSGGSMMEYLKNHPTTKKIPVIVMSAAENTAHAAKAAHAYNIDKPFELRDLQAMVKHALAQKGGPHERG